MTRQYEAVYIFDSALDEAAIIQRMDQFHTLLGLAEPPGLDHWGKRTLAYPVRKHETGYYVIARFETNPEALPEYERAVKLDESVLRFLVVANEGPSQEDSAPQAAPAEGADTVAAKASNEDSTPQAAPAEGAVTVAAKASESEGSPE